MSTLELVYKRIEDSKNKGLKPLVVFDLDDTLIDCRYRKRFVLREFCALELNQKAWKDECDKVLSAKLESYEYRVADFLDNLSIDNIEFKSALEKYWLSKYFTNTYLAADEFFPGAIRSLEKMRSLGAEIRYFTGRDEPGMKEGTVKKLNEHGLNDKLFMKPKADIADDEYKVVFFKKVLEDFDLVCFFENELRNLNPFVDQYPNSLFVWLDTLHSPNQPNKHVKIHTMTQWNQENY